jgi:hypothetical protein
LGFILLAGGAEFGGQMVLADRQAIMLAGGPEMPNSRYEGLLMEALALKTTAKKTIMS